MSQRTDSKAAFSNPSQLARNLGVTLRSLIKQHGRPYYGRKYAGFVSYYSLTLKGTLK